MAIILLIDADPVSRKPLEEMLAAEGYRFDTGASAAEARRLGGMQQYRLIVTRLQLPDGDGLDLLRWFAEHSPDACVVILSAFGAIVSTVDGAPGDLRRLVRRTLGASPRPLGWKEIERAAIEEALHANGGNRTHAARQLGISLRKLQYRLREYGLAGSG
jgi:DNA-binding NtrC family response regulator